MTTTQEHVYKVRAVERIKDGDTYLLRLDIGFHFEAVLEIRLADFDAAETRKGSAFERQVGVKAKTTASEWFESVLADEDLTPWVRTAKTDDFGRWLGAVWAEGGDGTQRLLGDTLTGYGQATTWPQRWFEKYDPQGRR